MKLRARTVLTTFSTTLVVAVLAAAWAIASPLQVRCAAALAPANIASAPSETAEFVSAINQLRVSKGLNPLVVDSQLSGIANDWAQQMAQNDGISHRLDLRAGITSSWKRLGENVGVGPTVGQLMDAFIASPGHYTNLVDPTFTHIGVGTVRTTGGLLYTAHEFAALESGAARVTAPPATTPRVTTPRVRTTTSPTLATPQVTAPQVTAPPVTSPPAIVAPVLTPKLPTTLEATVVRLPADKQLHNSGKNNQQEQKAKSNSRCRSHAKNLQAIAL